MNELREELDRIFDDFYRDIIKSPNDVSTVSRHRQLEVIDAFIQALPTSEEYNVDRGIQKVRQVIEAARG